MPKIFIEDVPNVEVGSKGVLLRIRDNQGANLGKLRIGKATIKWAKGSTSETNAKSLSVAAFVEYLNKLP